MSPCVAFNNHAGSTKSFDYVREHNDAVNRLDVITGREPITVDYAPGSVQVVEQHDGTRLALRKLDADYDVHDRLAAMAFLQKHAAKGQVVTGLLYVDPDAGRPARPPQHGGRAAQRTRGERPLPGHGGAGKDQRQPALAFQPRLLGNRPLDRLHEFRRRPFVAGDKRLAGLEQALQARRGSSASPFRRP